MVGRPAHKVTHKMVPLVDTAAEMALGSLAPSTITAYNKIVLDFKCFVKGLHESLWSFPVSSMHIALFMSHLYRKGIAPSSIASKLSALAFWHQIYFKQDPTSHFMIRRILNGNKKSQTI